MVLASIVMVGGMSSCANKKKEEKGKAAVPIRVDGKYGYMDKEGKVVVDPQFDGADDFSEDLAVIFKDGMMGVIDRDGKIVVDGEID